MGKRKSGDFAESVTDFWLGMAGAAAHGFGVMTRHRQLRKDADDDSDIVDDFTLGMQAAFKRADKVVEDAVKALGPTEDIKRKRLEDRE
jgi:hypothetical protein